MFCLLVSPDPLRRALLSDPEPRNPSYTKVVVGSEDGDDYENPHTPPPVAHYVAVDIPDDDSDVDDLECRAQPISPVRRAFVKALFVACTVFVAPALVGTAATRSVSYLQFLLVIVPTALTVMALFMAVMCVMDAEEEEDDEVPTLDRRLLAWSDSDTEADDGTPTTGRYDVPVDEAMYNRCGVATFVDDVLVPGVKGRAGKAPADGHGGVCARPSSGTRKACCAAAGLVTIGCLSAYQAWRCRTSQHT